MLDIEKAISCLLLSAFGWLVFISGYMYVALRPSQNEFTDLFGYLFLWIPEIVAMGIHVVNSTLGVILLLERTKYKTIFIPGIFVSLIYIVWSLIVYFD